MKYFGAHVSAAGGVENAPANAHAIGAEGFALFTTGYDCRLQGMRRLLASCNWFSNRKDSRFPSRRHDSGHGACDAGELVLGKYDRTDAVK